VTHPSKQILTVLLALVIVAGFVPGVAPAQASGVERVGGLVEVGEGETIGGDLSAVGGPVSIAGTATGDTEVPAARSSSATAHASAVASKPPPGVSGGTVGSPVTPASLANLALGAALLLVTPRFSTVVPFVGGVLRFLVLLVGLGAFVLAVRTARRDDGGGFVSAVTEDNASVA
jgi:hypothetical protein